MYDLVCGPSRRVLERCRGLLFPETKTTSYRVFRDEGAPGEDPGPL